MAKSLATLALTKRTETTSLSRTQSKKIKCLARTNGSGQRVWLVWLKQIIRKKELEQIKVFG